jgi:hypothetical protein
MSCTAICRSLAYSFVLAVGSTLVWRAGALAPAVNGVESDRVWIDREGGFRLSYFLVAVIADGDENLIVFPSTMPVHFWVPAVNSISLPRKRP